MKLNEGAALRNISIASFTKVLACLLLFACAEENSNPADVAEANAQVVANTNKATEENVESVTSAAQPTAGDDAYELGAIYRSDSRVSDLLTGCANEYYYDRDTSYMVPVLIEKLQKGYTEPLQRSKNELATLGPEAMLAVQRLAEKWYTDQAHESYAQNALDVAVMSDEPIAREIVLRFLQHPRSPLRMIALRGMALRHARPEDFDSLWFQLEGETVGIQEQFLPSLLTADRARAEELFVDWFANGNHEFLYQTIGPIIAGSRRSETAERCSEIQAQITPRFRPFIAACAARTGDSESLRSLNGSLQDENPIVRQMAALAAGQAGLFEQLKKSALEDSDEVVRKMAVAGLTEIEASPEVNAVLGSSAADPDRDVRVLALTAMINRGDSASIERALALLNGGIEEMHDGLVVLAKAMESDTALADRARKHLLANYKSLEHQPLEKRFSVIKPLGLVPGAETAQVLREIALQNPDDLSGRRTHLMLMVHASNSGESGRGWLFEQLKDERDPLRRIDLLWASTCYRTDAARERLHKFLAEPGLSPYEVLFAADALARLGPSEEVASLLKRICYRIEQDDVRQAMRCLLWKWY